MKSKKTKMAKEKVATEDPNVEVNASENEAENSSAQENEVNEPTIEDKLAEAKEALASAKDQNLRLYAEFENFKRRNAKERLELMSSANIETMQALLPVVDDFERALKNIEKNEENAPLFEGVELIYNKLTETLKQKGLKAMESSVGQTFDVETMEAITRIPVPDKAQDGKVIDEVERGYYLGTKVLRYARVVVAYASETE
jgi:molecular chaperone GrpE